MSYVVDFDILASDYNSFVGALGTSAYASQVDVDAASPCVGAIYGIGFGDRGYGQTSITLSAVAVSDPITSNEWTNMRNALAEILVSQAGVVSSLVPPASEMAIGEIIEAHESSAPTLDLYDFDSQIISANTNRFTVFSPTVLAPSGTITTTRATVWGNSPENITCEFDITWTSEENARFFFNTGGEILIDLSHPAGSLQDNSWDDTLAVQLGQIRMNATETTSTGVLGLNSTLGYFDLGGAYATIINGLDIGSGSYSDNDVLIDALVLSVVGTNGGNGAIVRIRVQLRDQNVEINPIDDEVSAGTIANVSVSKNTYLSNPVIETPTSTLVTGF